jgi:hypothetical protein
VQHYARWRNLQNPGPAARIALSLVRDSDDSFQISPTARAADEMGDLSSKDCGVGTVVEPDLLLDDTGSVGKPDAHAIDVRPSARKNPTTPKATNTMPNAGFSKSAQ